MYESQIGCGIVPHLHYSGKLEIVALVKFIHQNATSQEDTVSIVFTEEGLVRAMDALPVFLQRLREAKADPDWEMEIDPRI